MVVKQIRVVLNKAKEAEKFGKFKLAKKYYLDAADLAIDATKDPNVEKKLHADLFVLAKKYVKIAKELKDKEKIEGVEEELAKTESERKEDRDRIKGATKTKDKVPDEVELEKYILPDKIEKIKIAIGREYASKNVNYWVPGDEMNGIFILTGGSGSGKTNFLRSLITELTHQGYPSLVLDLHGDIESDIPTLSLDYRGNHAINPMALTSKSIIDGGPLPQTNELLQRFGEALPKGFSPPQFAYLRSLLLFTYHLKGIKQDNPESWDNTPPSFKDLLKILKKPEILKGNIKRDFVSMVPDVSKSTETALENKLMPILEHPAFSGKNLISIHKFLKEPARILLRPLQSLDMQFLAADTILHQIFAYVQSLGHTSTDSDIDKFRLFIIIDEVKLLAGYDGKINDSFSILNRLSTEGRKYGLGLILASQMLEHYGREIRANSATKLVFKPMDDSEIKRLSKELKVNPKLVSDLSLPGEGFIKKTSDMQSIHLRTFPMNQRPFNDTDSS